MSATDSIRTADHFLQCISTVSSAPKWSFGERPQAAESAISPGPGEYETKEGLRWPSSPRYGFGNESRGNNVNKLSTPAPGSYNPSKLNIRNSPQWTMAGRPVKMPIQGSPGPGSYDSSIVSIGAESRRKSYSFGLSERKNKPSTFFPGPGTYNPLFFDQHKPPSWIIGTASRKNLYAVKTALPGPADYQMPNVFQQGPKYTFSGKKEVKAIQSSPGPGEYSLKLPDGEKYHWSFGTKIKPLAKESFPGPGTYFTKDDGLVPRSGGQYLWTFGTEPKAQDKSESNPGPGFYDPKLVSAPRSSAWVFGTSKGSFNMHSSEGPAPGAYNLPSKLGEGAKYSWGNSPRLETAYKETEEKPGPSTYNPSFTSQRSSNPSWTFGSSKKSSNPIKGETPGPGQYDPKAEDNSPQWTMSAKHDYDSLLNSRGASIGSTDIGKLPATYTAFGY